MEHFGRGIRLVSQETFQQRSSNESIRAMIDRRFYLRNFHIEI